MGERGALSSRFLGPAELNTIPKEGKICSGLTLDTAEGDAAWSAHDPQVSRGESHPNPPPTEAFSYLK